MSLLALSASAAVRPPILPRPPLPPFDPGTWETADPHIPPSYHPVYTTLPQNLQTGLRWWRGNTWGVTLPGLPSVPGGASGAAQDRILTWFLDRYGAVGGPSLEDRILAAHLERGYTHFSLSPCDSFDQGMSVDDYVRMASYVRSSGLWVHHLLRSKYWPDLAHDDRFMADLIDRLLSAGALQVATPSWEMNWASPDECYHWIEHDHDFVGDEAAILLHFFPHYISWQRNGETPTDFWRFCYGKVDGVLYQCDPTWTAGMMTARITDALVRLAPGGLWGLGDSGRGHPIDVTAWEVIAQQQYNNAHDGNGNLADEDDGDLKGYELCCVPGPMPVMGYGNGGRMPDGSPL